MATTHAEINEHPSANAVTTAIDPVAKEADIERKLALYGAVEAFRQGRYPSNQQIDGYLHYLEGDEKAHGSVEKLSKEGRMLVQDFRNIVHTVKRMVHEKNGDELLQDFLYHTRDIDFDETKKDIKQNAKVAPVPDESERAKEGQQAVEHLRTLAKLIFTNSEARKLLKDISLIARDVAADAAVHVADVARPADQDLAKVDMTAPSAQWEGANGGVHGPNEPVPATGVGQTVDHLQSKADDVSQAAREHYDSTAQAVAHSDTTTAFNNATVPGSGTGDLRQEDIQREGQQVKEAAESLVNKIKGKIPQEHKDVAREQYGRAKDYANDKFPQERRDRFIYRLKKVIVECQRHRDYQEAIEFFLTRFESYADAGTELGGATGGAALGVRDTAEFSKAEAEFRTLLERFANGQSMEPIFVACKQVYADVKADQELRGWFNELDAYVRRVLQEPGFILTERSDKQGQSLLDSGKRFWSPSTGKYAANKDAVFDSIQSFFTAYADDPVNVQLGLDVKKLFKDLLMDSEGNLKFKHHLWNDVREVLLPSLASNVGYLPIPRIEYSDSSYDVVIENLTLESANLLPNIIEIEARNYFKLSPYASIKDKSRHSFTLSFSQVQCDLKDLSFFIRKKSGFPKLTDSGIADVTISGSGISGKIQLNSTGRKDHAFSVGSVKVKVDKLSFKVRGSKFSLLIAALRPLANNLIKSAVQKAIEESIRAALVQMDSQIADISERIEAAKDDENVSTLDAIKAGFEEKKEGAKKTVAETKPPGQFQISASNRDSKLVDWSSKGSILERQAIKDEEVKSHGATVGDGSNGWKSKAFDLSTDTQQKLDRRTGGSSNTFEQGSAHHANANASTQVPHTTATNAAQLPQTAATPATGTATAERAAV